LILRENQKLFLSWSIEYRLNQIYVLIGRPLREDNLQINYIWALLLQVSNTTYPMNLLERKKNEFIISFVELIVENQVALVSQLMYSWLRVVSRVFISNMEGAIAH